MSPRHPSHRFVFLLLGLAAACGLVVAVGAQAQANPPAKAPADPAAADNPKAPAAPAAADKPKAPAAPAAADQPQTPPPPASQAPMYDFEVKTIDGKPLKLSEFKGKVLLIVNTASHCGYTPQYAGLQTLHERYAERGLVVLGFPCNDFGKQEPGTEGEIKSFCESSYGVSFPLMAKVTVKSPDKAPVYKYLTEDTAPEIRGEIKWNFTKFLIGTDGRPVARFEPGTGPLDPALVAALEKALPKK